MSRITNRVYTGTRRVNNVDSNSKNVFIWNCLSRGVQVFAVLNNGGVIVVEPGTVVWSSGMGSKYEAAAVLKEALYCFFDVGGAREVECHSR
jgi:hypothetical protein